MPGSQRVKLHMQHLPHPLSHVDSGIELGGGGGGGRTGTVAPGAKFLGA